MKGFNFMSNFDYDVIVLGAGPGGYECAIRCAQFGKKTALVPPCFLPYSSIR